METQNQDQQLVYSGTVEVIDPLEHQIVEPQLGSDLICALKASFSERDEKLESYIESQEQTNEDVYNKFNALNSELNILRFDTGQDLSDLATSSNKKIKQIKDSLEDLSEDVSNLQNAVKLNDIQTKNTSRLVNYAYDDMDKLTFEMNKTKEQIEENEARIGNNSNRITFLETNGQFIEEFVTELKNIVMEQSDEIEKKDKQIEELTTKLDTLTDLVTKLSKTVEQLTTPVLSQLNKPLYDKQVPFDQKVDQKVDQRYGLLFDTVYEPNNKVEADVFGPFETYKTYPQYETFDNKQAQIEPLICPDSDVYYDNYYNKNYSLFNSTQQLFDPYTLPGIIGSATNSLFGESLPRPHTIKPNKTTDKRLKRACEQQLKIDCLYTSKNCVSFQVIGTTKNIYVVTLVGKPTCSCLDFEGGYRCKHILHVLHKVLKVDDIYKQTYSKEEIMAKISVNYKGPVLNLN